MISIKKGIEILSFLLSVIAIVLATFSYIESRDVGERARKLEIYNRLQTISKYLNLEFRSDSLYFTTLSPCPNETDEEKKYRLTSAAIEIGAIEALAEEKEESLVVFLKSVLLVQQGDYDELDKLFEKSDGNYKRSINDLRIKYETCIPREKNA